MCVYVHERFGLVHNFYNKKINLRNFDSNIYLSGKSDLPILSK